MHTPVRPHHLALGLLALVGCARASGSSLSPADSSAIAAVQAEYVRAWLADDTAGVLATLAPDAVLLPPGHEPVTGHAAIRSYWWPEDGSRTRITGFTWDVAEVLADGDLAVLRALSTVSWSYQKDTLRSQQTSRNLGLSVLQRTPRDGWRIAWQMWGPSLR